MLKDEFLIIFGEDFNRHPHSLEHIMRPFFSQNKILWVETIGLRSPTFSIYDFKRIAEKLISFFVSKKKLKKTETSQNFTIISPFMIPYNQFKTIRLLNQWSVEKQINSILKQNGIKDTILVSSVPQSCDITKKIKDKISIYFCVDDFSKWPGINPVLADNLENEIIKRSDLIFVTAENLKTTKSQENKKARLITHGVDFEHFNIGLPKKTIKEQFEKDNLTLCYFGLFDERTDQNIILKIAQHFPSVKIQIIGEVIVSVQELKKYSNIEFIGRINYSELPKKIQEIDILLLPYFLNELTININPLKLKEYMATSRAIISTPLPEVLKLKDYLSISRDAEGFISTIEDLISETVVPNHKKTLDYLTSTETWDKKAELFSSFIEERIMKGVKS